MNINGINKVMFMIMNHKSNGWFMIKRKEIKSWNHCHDNDNKNEIDCYCL